MHRTVWMVSMLAAAVAARPAAADQWDKTFTVTDHPTLRIEARDGNLRVERSSGGRIVAHLTTVGWRIGAGDLEVSSEQSGNHVVLVLRTPAFHWNLGWSRRSIDLTLEVPEQIDLDLRTGDGNVEVLPLSGDVKIVTGDGGIRLDGIKGHVRVESGDGGIEATGLDGTLDAHSGDGHIHVVGRFDQLRLDSGDGRVIAEARHGSLVAADWSVTTGDGPVSLRLPADLRADLDAHTGDGGISLDLPLEVSGTFSRSTVRGTLNGGGGMIRVRTGDGSVHIEKSE